jgi:hypothetical protein
MAADERDVHGELSVACQEFARAIERVHQPVLMPAGALRERRGGRFFRQQRQRRREPLQPGGDQPMGGQIRRGQRGVVGLGGGGPLPGLIDSENLAPGRARDAEDLLQQPGAVGRHAPPVTPSAASLAMMLAAASSGVITVVSM